MQIAVVQPHVIPDFAQLFHRFVIINFVGVRVKNTAVFNVQRYIAVQGNNAVQSQIAVLLG